MKRIALLSIVWLLFAAVSPAQSLRDFKNPPQDCRVKTWWFFGYEQTTEEGIVADARSFRDAGFGGVVYYDQNHASPASPLADDGFSTGWWKNLKFAVRQAEQQGLSVELNISNGFVAGGSWIDPAHAMQKLESAQISVKGGTLVETALPAIEGREGYVRDVALLAFPSPGDSLIRHFTARYAAKGKGKNGAMQIPGPRGEFSGAKWEKRSAIGMLQCSADSLNWRDVVELEPMYSSQGVYPVRTEAFPAVDAKYWRVDYYTDETLRGWSVGPEALLDRWEELAGLQSEFAEPRRLPSYSTQEVIEASSIIDLSSSVGEDGILRWNAPEGYWTILRFASVMTGGRTKHGRPNLMGYECDKLSAEAAELHWNSYVKVILDSLRSDGINNVSGICMDSHEAGAQNWTPLMPEEFRERRGYDLLPCLPVLAGYVVESYEKSSDVLRDFRQTINDCITDNYYGTFQTLCTREGLSFTAQAIGNARCIDGDAIAVKKAVQKPQGEFWSYQQTGAYDVKDCSSAAHLYGKPIASAEAFTDATYEDTPYTLKRVADIAFSMGAQEFSICATPHIPYSSTDAPYIAGREYAINRSNPRWEDLKPVWAACARSMYMLRQGIAAPDVLVYLGDDVPVKILTHRLPAGLDGLDWDACTADALRTRLHPVEGGGLATPEGIVYKALVIEEGIYVSDESKAVLESFREAGVNILSDASGIPRPLQIEGEGFVHTHRTAGGKDLFFIANILDEDRELVFSIPDAGSTLRVLRTADGSSRRVRRSADGRFRINLAAGESVFVEN